MTSDCVYEEGIETRSEFSNSDVSYESTRKLWVEKWRYRRIYVAFVLTS